MIIKITFSKDVADFTRSYSKQLLILLDFIVFLASDYFEKLKQTYGKLNKKYYILMRSDSLKKKKNCNNWILLTIFLAAASSFFIPAENSEISIKPQETFYYRSSRTAL